MKISVVGVGAYSLALSINMCQNGHHVLMWTESDSVYDEYQKNKNLNHILDAHLPKNINLTTSFEELLKECDLIVIATSSKYVDIVCQKMQKYYKRNIPICIATKGIEESSERFISEIVKTTLGTDHIALISGPTFATDLAHLEPVGLALASSSFKAKKMVLKALESKNLKLRPTKDMIGLQLCGSIKNIIAIASGMIAGLGYSESTQALLINEALLDMKKIIYYLGGNPKTILSFAGLGDLTLTCMSNKSRNYRFGYIIGKTNDITKINNFLNNNTMEGYYTLDIVYKLLNNKNINIPLITTIYNIVYNEDNPITLINTLIEKD